MAKDQLTISTVLYAQNAQDILNIRQQVFIDEQDVPVDREIDALDEQAIQILGYLNGTAVATARVRILKDQQDDIAKIERMAVLKSSRGHGFGKQLMSFTILHLQNMGLKRITLESQTHACSFYEELGFIKHGEEFLDVNIPHYKMWLAVLS